LSKERKNKSLELHRIAVAARDIECAQDGFKNIETLKAKPADKLYQPLIFGAVASYCRPFTNNDGFGILPKRWKKFEGLSELMDTHKKLIDYRNIVVAHSSITCNKLTIYPPNAILTVGEHSQELLHPGYGVSTPLLGPDWISKSIEVCEFQHNRMVVYLEREINERFSQPTGDGSPFIFNHLEH
tara:strand:- start:1665 stop:2219 length:555 start_codon:yes stop_codon:yes gene_type:complete